MRNFLAVSVSTLFISKVSTWGLVNPHTSYPDYVQRDYGNTTDVELHINSKNSNGRNNTAPYLYGLMFEDISHSGDGGIYAELVVNRAFQGSSENPTIRWGPSLVGWGSVGGARLSLDALHPLSDALPTVLQVDIPANATGEVGFINYGYWGMDVTPQQYTASFYVLANEPRYKKKPVTFNLSIRSNLTGETWASSAIKDVTVPTVDYIQLNATIQNIVAAPNSNNSFVVTMNAAEVAGQTFYFNLISLFPETFKGRRNGLRRDIAEAFYDMKPKFLRFPGGNNLEGNSIQTRWNWRKTIGPLKERPGRPANWGYYNTDGLGLLEYLEWTEDMEIEPVLAVYAGFSLDSYGSSGTSYPPEKMPEAVEDALDELEYCMGSTETKYGALRAAHGHSEPFNIKFIELGNEDWFSTTYPYRWEAMYKGLKAVYPNVTFISTTFDEHANYTISIPAGEMWDTHHYEEPQYFIKRFDFWDNWQATTSNEGVGVLLGEYSVYQVDTPDGAVNWTNPPELHVAYPRLVSAIAEGVYAMGGERNPGTVKMSSYAPSLMNRNWYNWTPDMIGFDADPKRTLKSASYWQQWMFARFRGTQTLPVEHMKGDINPLFWVASIDGPSHEIYLKLINVAQNPIPLSVQLDDPSYSVVNGTILTANDVNAFNTLENMDTVVPKTLALNGTSITSNGTFSWNVPGYSITILQFGIE